MKSFDIQLGKVQNEDYHKPYEANSSLAKRGLMKIILPAGVKLDQSTILLEENVDSRLYYDYHPGSHRGEMKDRKSYSESSKDYLDYW